MDGARSSADAVVVGGGCMGASIAWHLARGGADVVLLERGHLGGGSTGHSGALVRRHYDHPIGIALAHESLRFFERFERATGRDAGFTRIGFTTAARERDVPALRRLLVLQRRHGVAAKLVDLERLRDLEPGIRADDLAVGAYDPRAGYADPVATTLGFARAATELGAEVREWVDVRKVLVSNGRVSGVRTTRGIVRAPRVVLAAGNGTHRLAAAMKVRLPIRFVRGEVAVLHRPPDFGPPPKLHFDVYHDTYSRPDGTRDTLVGYMGRGLRRTRARPTPFDETLPEAIVRDLQSRLAARFPGIARAQRRGGWAGLYDVTPDHWPILGSAGPRGLFVAAGFSGHGFKLCPSVGRILADDVLGKRRDSALRALALSRFARRRPVRPVAPFPARGRRLP